MRYHDIKALEAELRTAVKLANLYLKQRYQAIDHAKRLEAENERLREEIKMQAKLLQVVEAALVAEVQAELMQADDGVIH